MNSASALSIQGLSTLNAILGSTESSRAVAAIITLLKDELNKPGLGNEGIVISYKDLIVGTIGFVLLQRWGRRKTELEFRNGGIEEVIWDTVVDDRGFRADVVGTRRKEIINVNSKNGQSLPFTTTVDDEEFQAWERDILHDTNGLQLTASIETHLSDEDIQAHIMEQLPAGARAVVTSETVTAKTIKVDIYDAETTHIEAPPGTVMVAERLNHGSMNDVEKPGDPNQTIIFRTALKRSTSAEIESHEQLELTSKDSTACEEVADGDDVVMMKETQPGNRIDLTQPEDEEKVTALDSATLCEDSPRPVSNIPGPVANQKKSRLPMNESHPKTRFPEKRSSSKTVKVDKSSSGHKSEKAGVIKKALKTLSPNQSSVAIKDLGRSSAQKKRESPKTTHDTPRLAKLTIPDVTPKRVYPAPSFSRHTSPVASPMNGSGPYQQAQSSYFAVREKRRDSTVSQTETYSVHSIESRPGSPSLTRTHSRVTSGLTHTKSEIGLAVRGVDTQQVSINTPLHHKRSRSYVPSLYSMATKDSEEAIILAPKTPLPRVSIYEDQKMLTTLAIDGKVPGIFPDRHLVKTVRRFSRFATASYGSNFLQVMGLASMEHKSRELFPLDIHQEHNSFSKHTGMPADTILLSSFFDPEGVSGNTTWAPQAISPLIHFISLDHDSKAVVLTCRGTLGFEDVLTDMTCDYDDIIWQGHRYKVHKGIHASARRLLSGSGSRVMATLRAALEEYPEYGLVLCGHSLGGAVAAILAILVSEPANDPSKSAFVTGSSQKLLVESSRVTITSAPAITLPRGRPIHVYAFGPPATVKENLRLATRGLITTIVNHADIVPYLSLGTLHDFRAIALHLKTDTSDAFGKLRSRVWQRVKNTFSLSSFKDKGPPPPENLAGDGPGEDTWAWAALKTLRECMVSDKLVPPGEIFVVETTRVFDRLDLDVARESMIGLEDSRDDRTEKLYRALGRPATRVQFKLVRDVETRFGELRFGRDMFGDHSPGRYEASLAALENGICDD